MSDVDDINHLMALGEFLANIGSESSYQLLENADDALTSLSCKDCGENVDYGCACGGRYMQEYDDGAGYED
jgi:hypothetical protein